MYKLVINFADGSTMPISWVKGTMKVSVKASVRKLLTFRLMVRESASKKSSALPLRKFSVDFWIDENFVNAGIENVQFSPKKHLIEESLFNIIDMAYAAADLRDGKATIGAPSKLEAAQAN